MQEEKKKMKFSLTSKGKEQDFSLKISFYPYWIIFPFI